MALNAQPAPASPKVTLSSIPAEVDAAWWRRHAHLLSNRDVSGHLRFEPGAPVEGSEPCSEPPAPLEAGHRSLVGQDDLLARFRTTAVGCRRLGESFPHVLLLGPARASKAALAREIAVAAQRPLMEVSAPKLADRLAWLRVLAGLAEDSVLFVDAVAALPHRLLCDLFKALTERRLTLVLWEGFRVREVTLHLPRFTLVAAMGTEGSISRALWVEFGFQEFVFHDGKLPLVDDPLADDELADDELADDERGDVVHTDSAAHGSEAAAEGASPGGRTQAQLGPDVSALDPTERRDHAVLRVSCVPLAFSGLVRAAPPNHPPSLTRARRHAPRQSADAPEGDGGAPNVRQAPPEAPSTS